MSTSASELGSVRRMPNVLLEKLLFPFSDIALYVACP